MYVEYNLIFTWNLYIHTSGSELNNVTNGGANFLLKVLQNSTSPLKYVSEYIHN